MTVQAHRKVVRDHIRPIDGLHVNHRGLVDRGGHRARVLCCLRSDNECHASALLNVPTATTGGKATPVEATGGVEAGGERRCCRRCEEQEVQPHLALGAR